MAWIKVASVLDLPENETVVGYQAGAVHVAVYRIDDAFYATDNICTHQHAFLSEGVVEGDCIECPLHQGVFHVPSGEVRDGPVKVALATYPVRVEGEDIYADVPARE